MEHRTDVIELFGGLTSHCIRHTRAPSWRPGLLLLALGTTARTPVQYHLIRAKGHV